MRKYLKNGAQGFDLRHFVWLALMFIPLISGCMTPGKSALDGMFKAQVADQVKVADTVKGADKITGIEKVADKAQINPNLLTGVNNKIEKNTTATNTKVGGNLTNDSEVMKQYLNSTTNMYERILRIYGEQTEKYITLMKWIIGTLFASVAMALANLIGLVIWVIKFLLKRGADTDEFMQAQVVKKGE